MIEDRCPLCLGNCENNPYGIFGSPTNTHAIKIEECKHCGNVWVSDQWWNKRVEEITCFVSEKISGWNIKC